MNKLENVVLVLTICLVTTGKTLAVSNSTTQPTTISVRAEISRNTNFSTGFKQLHPTTTELVELQGGSSVTPFDAGKFFNSSDLVDHGHLNMSKVLEKLANGSSNVLPLNATSATFRLSPNDKTPDKGQKPSSNTSNKEAMHSMGEQLHQMGLQNLTITPEEPSSHSFRAGESVHVSNTVTPSPLVSTTKSNQTNSSEIEDVFPDNPNDPLQSEYGVIIHASVFFTNGATTPREPYPKDPYNASFWKDEFNQLTNLGKFQSFMLGEWLASRYADLLLNGQFSPRTVRIDSGQANSVFTSAESLLAGLFPPHGSDIWNPALLWQPIPIHSEPSSQDSIVSMSKMCRQYDSSVSSTNSMPEWIQQYKNYEENFTFIGNNTGFSFAEDNMYNNLLQSYNCYNDLTMEQQLDLPLPNWTSKVYPEPLQTLATKYFQFCTYTDAMKKYKAGQFLKSVVEDLQNRTSNHSVQRLHLYSGNTYGLSAVMNTLGIFNSLVPPPASTLLFEFREKHHRQTITVSLKNSSSNPPYLLQITNCEKACDYTKFISILSNYTLSNWDDECNIISFGDLTYSTPLLVAGLVVIIVLIFLCLLLLLKCCKCLSKNKGKISYG